VGQQGTFYDNSKTAKPNKFTGQDPSKLHPFIVSCIMAFDSKPQKFVTDHQQVSYATSYLTDIAMLWWQPILVTYPEPSILIDQLNVYFGQPNLTQASKLALCTLKMHDYQHVNKYMIEFSKNSMHTDGVMQLYMVKSIGDLLSASRTSSCHWTSFSSTQILYQI